MKQNNYTNTHTTKFNRWMLFAGIAMLSLFATNTNAQIAVTVTNPTNTTPNLAASYTDLATAITALNGVVMTGPVTLTLSGTETAPIKGYVLGTTGLSGSMNVTNTLTINGGGTATINAGVGTAASPNSTTPDAMFNILGCDYVTLDGIVFTDGNSASATVAMESGVAFYKLSVTDGCRFNTIQNCTFNMQRINNATGSGPMVEGSIAIRTVNAAFATPTTAMTITSAGGTHSYNKFYTNTIDGGNAGIVLSGFAATTPFTAGDTGNDIGGTSSGQGNIITNFGGGAATNPASGIRAINQWGINISYNTINNNNGSGVNHATTLRGIYAQSGTSASADINNNTVTMHGGATTSQVSAIENTIGSTAASNTVNINNNTVQNSDYTTATSATFYAVYNTASAATVNMNGNTVTGNTMGASATATSCTFYGVYSSATVTTCATSSNTVTNNSILNGGGSFYGVRASTSLWTANSNTITGNTIPNNSGTLSATLYCLYNASSPTSETINNNTIHTNTITSSSTSTSSNLGGIYLSTSSSSNKTISGNLIHTLTYTNSSTGYATVRGIYQSLGATINMYNNKVYGLSADGSSANVHGIYTASGTTYNIYNNIIGNLTSPTQANSGNLSGLYISSGTTVNAHYNSIYLNATSSGTNFGSSGIYASTTPALTLRNNLVVNLSTPTGTGNTAAYRRSSSTLSSYSASSNNNLFYAGTPGAANLIYVEGTSTFTSPQSTIAAYQSFMSTRDQASVTENPTFTSTTGSSADFLHFAAATNTLAESGGSNVSGVTDDFDGNVRQGNGGYAGAGTAPDIGADEFEGNNPAPSITGVSITPTGNQCTASSRAVSCTVTTPSGTITGVVINYSLNGVAQSAISMVNTSGNIWDGTIPAASPANAVVVWSIVATNSIPYSITYTGTGYQDAPFTGISASATATPPVICGVGSTTLAAVFNGPGVATLGAGALTSSSTAFSPFNGTYGGAKTQIIMTAAELQGLGLAAGNITSIGFDITSAGAALTGLGISMGHTALTEFPTPVSIVGGLTSVYSTATFTPVAGINTFTLNTPFSWNGTSNVIVSICWSNNNASNTSSTVKYDVTSDYKSQSYRQDNETDANLCAFTGATGLGTNSFTRSLGRAQLKIGGTITPSLTYSWSDGTSTVGSGISLSQSPTVNTTYTVTATIAGGCTSEATVLVTVDDLTILGTSNTDLTCNASGDGAITVNVTSTAGGLMYSLNGGTPQASATFTGLSAGSYTIVVTNSNGCSKSAVTSLNEPAAVVTVASNDGPVCDGATVNLSATGAYVSYAWTGPNSYSASGAAQAFNIALADAGVYTVVATDGIGCTGSSSTTVVVTANTPVSVSLAATPSLSVCTGDQVTYTATPTNGGTTPLYEFFVNNVSTGAASASNTYAFNPIDQDAVHVFMTSDITCTSGNPASSDTLVVSVSGAVAAGVTVTPSANNLCGTASVTFTAVATAGGGAPNFDFYVNSVSVQNGLSNTYSYSPANDDTIRVVMTSSFNCATGSPATSTDVIMVIYTIPSAPTITPGGATTFCAPGSVTLTSSYTGGNVWSTTETTDAISVSASGSYTVTYTDGNGCSATSAAEVVTVNAASAVISGSLALCTGGTNVLTATATPAATAYLWSPGSETTNTISVTAGGSYSVQTTDANGCTATDMVTVVENANPTASISGNSSYCTGVPETLTATANAGSGTITSYQWVLNGSTNVGTNQNTYAAATAGSYTVIVTNSNGCSVTSAAHVLSGTGALAGTYTIDQNQAASCTNYLSFAAAFSDLNTVGISADVTFEVAAGQIDTANLTLDMCALGANAPNASQKLAFRKTGAGANPIITAGTGVGTADVIVKIVGVDYLTFDGIDLRANANNVTSITQSEVGYALLKCSGTDGAQNDTIKNCTVTLNKANTNTTVGIYAPNLDASLAAVTVTAASGSHSNNKYFSNTVTNSYSGIVLGGMNDVTPYALYDQNNEIGAAGLGNTVTNFGGGTAATYGIYADYQNGFNLVSNTVNSGASAGTGLINGIRLGDMKNANANVNGNTVTINSSAASTTQCIAIRSSAGSRIGRPESDGVLNTVNITNNIIQNCTYTGSSDLWLMFQGRAATDTLSARSLNITGNQLLNNTSTSTNATGTYFGIISQNMADTVNITGNTITGNVMNGAVGHQMRSIVTGANSLGSGTLIYVTQFNVSNNVVEGNTSTATTGQTTGISVELYTGAAPALGSTSNVNNNRVGATTVASTTGAYTGISSSAWGNTVYSLSGNKVYNVVRSANTTGTFTGITATNSGIPVSMTIDNDTVSGITAPTATTSIFYGVYTLISPTSAPSSISNNLVMNNIIHGTGTWYGVYQTGSPDSLTMTGNIVRDNRKSQTGTMYGVFFSSPLNLTFTNNVATGNKITGASATCTMYGFAGSTSKYLFNNNTAENIGVDNMTGTSTATVYGYYNLGSPLEETITNNVIRNLFVKGTSTGSSTIRGMYHSTTSAAGAFRTYRNNVIDSLYTSVGLSENVVGIWSATGNAITISKNKIFGLYPGQSTGTSTAKGIQVSSGTTVSIENNLVGLDVSAAPAVLTNVAGLVGVEISGGTTQNVRYNTIRLAGNGSGTTFGSSGISITSTTPTVTLNNNLVLNLAGAGGGTAAASAVALRRSAAALTGYSSASNKNIWYAGTPSSSHLIYFDGTNSDQTLGAFKTRVSPAEAGSQSENVTLLSTVGASAQYLHVDASIATLAESGGVAITGIDTDFDGDIRQGSVGYPGTGTSPDVGADEFNGISAAPYITNVIVTPGSTCVAASHSISADVTTAVGVIDSVSLSYSFNGVPQPYILMTVPTSGNTYTFTIPAATPSNAIVTWSLNGWNSALLNYFYSGTSYQDEYMVSPLVTASPSTICLGDSITLLAGALPPAAPSAASYCASTHASGCSTDGMLLVVMNTLNNPSVCPGSPYYSDFSGLGGSATTTLAYGNNPHSVAVTFDTDGNQYFGAWIDYNHNGVYEASEFLGASGNAGASGTIAVSFSIPSTAYNGLTHMRIVGGNDSPVLATQACGASSSGFGETEDYDVTITGATNVIVSPIFTSYSWFDGTNTYTGNPATAIPTTAGTYTYTLTAGDGLCSVTAVTDTVEVLPIPAAPNATDSIQCGNGAPFAYVQGTPGATLNWYDAAVGGNLLQSSTDTTYTTSINATTTFYVAELGTNGCPGLRVAVTETVTSPDPIDAQSTFAAVCPGTSIDLSVVQTGSTNTYNYTWIAQPAAGSGISGSLIGNPVSATPVIPGTYNYVVTAVDIPNNCVIQDSVSVLVYNIPTITSIDANPDTACAGSPVILTALTPAPAPGTAQIGTGTLTTSTYPYYRLYGSSKTQMLYLASELSAAGLIAGNITSIGFNVTTASTNMPNVKISLKNTASTTISAFETGMTQVATEADYIPVVGVSNHPVTPFYWNGTSNLLVEFCFENNDAGGSSTSVSYTNPGFASVFKQYSDLTPSHCSTPTGTTSASSSTRPNLYIGGVVNGFGSGTYSWSWNPGGGTANQVTVNPTTSTNYTVTATDGTTMCTNTATVNVVVNATPPAPTAFNGGHCGNQTPTAYVTRSVAGTTFNWYFQPTGGTAIAGQNDSILISYPRNQVDTFYVSEIYATGPCEGPRVMLIETNTAADAITATATVPNDTICPFGTVTLSATQGTTNTYTTYTWTTIPAGGSATGQNTTAVVPNNAGQLIWYVTASDGSCVTNAQDTIFVIAPPVISSVTQSTDSICPGTSVTLTALTDVVSGGLATVGVQTTTSISGSPLRGGAGTTVGNKVQYLFTAAELTAAGLYAGSIDSIGFILTSSSTTYNSPNFTIRMGHTGVSTLTSTYESDPASIVFGPTNYASPTVAGNHYIPITPFIWNGTSNILIQICNDPINPIGSSLNAAMDAAGTGKMIYSNNALSCATVTGTLASNRMVMMFGGQVNAVGAGSLNWTWNPGSLTGNSVVVTPAVTTTYTVTAGDPNPPSCYNEETITVFVHPEPLAPLNPVSDVQCGSGIPTIGVTRSGPATDTFLWYDAPTGGTALVGENDSVLTSLIVSATTTYYIAEYNGFCEGPRVPVTVTVNLPDLVTINAVSGVCLPSTTFTLDAIQTGSTSNYVYTWSANPSGTAGLSGTSGASVSATPTALGTYTYTVSAVDAGAQCALVVDHIVAVNNYPTITNVTASPSTTCAGDSVNLSANSIGVGAGTAQIGVATTTTSTYPYYRLYGSSKTQMLYKATELTAAGLVAGNITSIGFDISTVGTYMPNVRISLKNTASTVLVASTFESGLTQVASIDTVFPVLGVNAHPITPFYWNGTSNILVEYCFENNDGGATSSTVRYSNPGFSATVKRYLDNAPTYCSNPSSGTFSNSSTIRPNLYIGGTVANANLNNTLSWSWNPGSLSGSTVAAYPTVTTTYTVTAAAGACTDDTTVTVTVIPLPATPTATNSLQCGYGTPTCSVSGGAGPFAWYLSPTGGTALAGQSGTSLVSYPISETDTFYVSEFNGTCWSSRAQVIAEVTPVDTVTATLTTDTICLGSSTTLGILQAGGNGNTYAFTWTVSPDTSISGITGSASGSPLVITPTGAGTFVYTVNSVDAACVAVPSSISLVVAPIPSITVNADLTVCDGGSVLLTANSPSFIPTLRWTELMVQGWIASGYSGFTPPYFVVPTGTTEDIWEVTNLGTAPVDPSGVTFEHWTTASTVAHTVTIPSGAAMVPPGGSILLHANSVNAIADLVNNVYHFGGVNFNIGSGTAGGYIIKKNGVIIDAVAVNGMTFPAAAGLSASDWVGSIPSNSGQNGSVLIKNDIDSSGAWAVTSTAGYKSSYGTLNPGVTVTLPPTGVVAWSSIPSGFSGNTAQVTVGPVTAATQYIATMSNIFGCESSDTVLVTPTTAGGVGTIVSTPDTICNSGSASLTLTGVASGATIQWQSSPSGLINTWTNVGIDSVAYNTGTLTSTTYFRAYATCTTTDTSNVKEVMVVVPTVTATNNSRCGIGQITLTATSNGTVSWYAGSSGGSALYVGNPFDTTLIATTTYWLEASIGTCINTGGRVPITATLNPAPPVSFNASSTSVCDGQSVTLTASSPNSGYTYYWSTNGSAIVYTGNPYIFTPTATNSYYLLAVDSSGGANNLCGAFDGPVTITWNEQPIVPVVSPSSTTVCAVGDSVLLTVTNAPTVSSGFAYSGTGTVQNAITTTTDMPPYGNYYTGKRDQMLILASDLIAQGVAPGPLTSVAFDVVSNGSLLSYNNFTVKIGHTAATSLSTTFEPAPAATVWNQATFNPVAGWNQHTFSSAFVWDGSSNLLVETYFSNCVGTATCSGVTCTGVGSGITYDENAITNNTTTSYVSHSYFYSDGSGCSPETQTIASTTNSTLPNMRFGAQVGSSILYTWNPGGQTGASVYVTPTASTLYTVTASLGICSASATVQVDYTPINLVITPSGPTTFCGSGTVTLDAGAGYAAYSWSDGTSVIGTTQMITVSPTATTSYTATVDSGACTVSETIDVTVYPATAINITPSTTIPICGGVGNVTLTADAGYTNYSWNPGSETTQAITVSPASTTTYTVTGVDGNGCTQTGTYTVVSNPAPPTPVITPAGPVTLCWDGVSGTTFVNLTADTTGAGAGASIGWDDIFLSTDDFIDVYAADYGQSTSNTFTITVTNSYGCVSTASVVVNIDPCAAGLDLDLTVFIEGYYIGPSTMWSTLYDLGYSVDPSETDTIEVNLWSAGSLSNPTPDYSEKVIVHNDGTASVNFPTAVAGSYYIAVKHRNSIETWSLNTVAMASGVTIYNFSTALSQAYDDGFNPPMQSMGGVYAIYSGDVNQDGTVDGTDLTDIDNDNNIFAFGYNVTDCTGDGATDSNDIIIVDNNKKLFLFYARPY
ncbi:MAG: hypothetical protein EYC69_14720 [Bacteroidetes bacterium]|nr:MAG: hypothetical protein EYC69_14720 [Bacteroidota bacterium]